MSFDEIAQKITEQNERIEKIEQQLSELLDRVAKLRHEASQRKRRVRGLMFEAVPDFEGEILSCADLLIEMWEE